MHSFFLSCILQVLCTHPVLLHLSQSLIVFIHLNKLWAVITNACDQQKRPALQSHFEDDVRPGSA